MSDLLLRIDLLAIKERLRRATYGPWRAADGGAECFSGDESANSATRFYAEDDCILTYDKREVLGCSEWMRVKRDDLEFMAHARQDIEMLIAEVERLRGREKP